MGCVKAIDYDPETMTLVTGVGIQGVYSSLADCEDDCGICCKWDCGLTIVNKTIDLISTGIYSEDDLLPTGNWDKTVNSYGVAADCIYELMLSSIPTGTSYVELGEAYPTPPLSLSATMVVFNSGYPSTTDNWLIKSFAEKGYESQKECDNLVTQFMAEAYGSGEIRYFECISGEILDKTADALSPFDIVFFGTGGGLPGLESAGRFPNYEIQNNPVIGTNINYSYHEYVGNPDTFPFDSTGIYSINSPATIPCLCGDWPDPPSGSSGGTTTPPPTTTGIQSPDPACYEFRDFSEDISGCEPEWPTSALINYTCDTDMNKSGCLYGGVDSPSGVAVGYWFSGISCAMAESYGGCSGLINL